MSEKALPLLFINLGGEMLYVLDQRLNAQKIQNEKAKKIMSDIIVNMFSDGFLDEIFRLQELCSKKALKTIFERLAHTSIMRLNESSMDKLFDLMTMAVKYQICLCSKPREVLLVTLNHFDVIRSYVNDSPNGQILMEQAYKRINKAYGNLNEGEFQLIRQTILYSLQDLRIKVSIFLKDKVQNWNGSFVLPNGGPVPPGSVVPGSITYYENADEKAIAKVVRFNPGPAYKPAEREGSYEEHGDRISKFGTNVYASARPSDVAVQPGPGNTSASIQSDWEMNVMNVDPKAKAQLDLLCKLIGSSSRKSGGNDFKLNLFNNEEEEFIYTTQVGKPAAANDPDSHVISIDQSKRQRDARLNKVMQDFDDDDDDNDANYRRNEKHKQHQQSSNRRRQNDDDDEDDICAMMDRFNK